MGYWHCVLSWLGIYEQGYPVRTPTTDQASDDASRTESGVAHALAEGLGKHFVSRTSYTTPRFVWELRPLDDRVLPYA